ncbi:MAG: hypothetical protein KA054_01725 [Candidatus Moranbacteria bacterium]|nr:hypothetical protein [Candidatus Moranbacteria bacterium]
MSLYFGFQGRLKQKSTRTRRNFLRDTRALIPLFLVMGSGFTSADSEKNIFSELAGLPAIAILEKVGSSADRNRFISEESDAEQDVDFIRCRWQTDRMLITSLGKGVVSVSTDECSRDRVDGKDTMLQAKNREIHEKVVSLTSDGYPLSVMAESIATYDPHIAGLIVGIAKKESNWGRRTPKLHGEECFNYWGYRGYGNRGVTEDGYGCFEKPADAVHTIGNRLIELSLIRGTTDPERMVIWKCGSSCATHSPESVRKWISDVRLYYQQFPGVL